MWTKLKFDTRKINRDDHFMEMTSRIFSLTFVIIEQKNNLFDFQGLDIKEKAWMQVGQVPVDDCKVEEKWRMGPSC